MNTSQYKRPSEEDLLALARMVAKVAHSGQTREGNGEPYFNHAERVAENVRVHHGLYAATIAYLHDTIEDTTVTRGGLRELFPEEYVHDVLLLTRGTDEAYGHYLLRLTEYGSDAALQVKLADLTDNLSSLDTLPRNTDSLRERYVTAENMILAELERRSMLRDAA